jgi:hypothetical protein
MSLKNSIQHNPTFSAIIIFLILFTSIQLYSPAFLYNSDGSLRDFGVGYKNKTILPVWLLSIVLGILSYLGVRYYAKYG